MADLVFLGTPTEAVPTLRALLAAGHSVRRVVTRADRRRGRGGMPTPSPVKSAALEADLEVAYDLGGCADLGAELGVVVAYGRIVPAQLLERLPMVNVHFSLLPRWRGAAPVERALLAGDTVTGVSLMELEAGLDIGPVYAQRSIPIGPGGTAADLRWQLAEIGAAMMVELLAGGVSAMREPVPQSGTPTYAEKLGQDDLRLAWEEPADVLDRRVRAGRAWTTFRGRRLHVLEASVVVTSPGEAARAGEQESGELVSDEPVGGGDRLVPGELVGTTVQTGGGGLVLRRVQPESRGPIDAGAWVRGMRVLTGERLGS